MTMRRPFQTSQSATLYLHFPCFDGLISAVLAADFLEITQGWKISRFSPVNYDLSPAWLSMDLAPNAAVVDFLYHPGAQFWADHHTTSFLRESDREALSVKDPQRLLLYDPHGPSCARLLWGALGTELPNAARYFNLVYWANKIDSASYDSVEEALFGAEPALQISMSMAVRKDDKYCQLLLRALRSQTLEEVALLAPVRKSAMRAREEMQAGLALVRDSIALEDQDIAVFRVRPSANQTISRYSPFYFLPQARYSIGLVESKAITKITAMRNPWLDFESVPLGQAFAKYGGGGHQRVASVVIQPGVDPLPVLSSLLRDIQLLDSAQTVKQAYA